MYSIIRFGLERFLSSLHSLTKGTPRGGSIVDISVMIRWVVVFLIIFVLLMALVFSYMKKKA